jgi:hypothetical protein
MKKKFDATAAKKIINQLIHILINRYAEQINIYMKENTCLKTQVEDLKTTLSINKEIMYKHIGSNSKESVNKLFDDIRNENNRLTELVNNLHKEKAVLEKKVISIIKIAL